MSDTPLQNPRPNFTHIDQLELLAAGARVTPNAIVITDERGIIEWVNPAFEKISGYMADEMIGHKMNLVKSGEHGEEFFAEMWKTIMSGRDWHGEVVNRSKDGRLYNEEMTITPMQDASGVIRHFIAVKKDVTERKRLEAQLMRAQRLESIGMLATGIAHDLNNVLAPVLMSIELLKLDMPAESARDNLDLIEAAANRGAGIIRQLLTFVKGIEGERTDVHLRHVLKGVAQLISQTFPRNIELVIELPPDVGAVKGDVTQLEQVFLNLCVNARDAMPGGGVLGLRAQNCRVDEAKAALHPGTKAGEFVMVAVSDTGAGIVQEHLDRVFEPFFSTKSRGRGTGLGLATAHGIVRSHGGFIEVSSVLGKGSEFRVFLPVCLIRGSVPRPVAAKGRLMGNGRCILVVDDDEAIRQLMRDILARRGFIVVSAVDGVDALAQFRASPGRFCAVITDMMMPRMNGAELAAVLNRTAPEVPIIASSGLMSEDMGENPTVPPASVTCVLSKPYTEGTLMEALSRVLPQG
jgi:PAS domain S-box-containing protein